MGAQIFRVRSKGEFMWKSYQHILEVRTIQYTHDAEVLAMKFDSMEQPSVPNH